MGIELNMDMVRWILIGLYVLLSCLYAYDKFWNHGSIQESLFSLFLCLVLPGIGFIVGWMMDYYGARGEERDYTELFEGGSFYRDELKVLRPLNKTKELNRVPIGEALAINDFELRRKLIMDTLKEDNTLEYLDVLREALENEDSETSHYASSIIMQLQANVQNRMVLLEKEFELHPDNTETAAAYERELFELLSSNLLPKENMRKYFLRYARLSERLLAAPLPEEDHLRHRIDICFLEKDFTRGAAVAEQYLELYPSSEDAVLCKIKLCIYTKDWKSLNDFLQTLSGRPVILTQKTLEYIRFFKTVTPGHKGSGVA